jgi:serine/threonine-protein kinase RsbW
MPAVDGSGSPPGFEVALPFGQAAAGAARTMVGKLLLEQGCSGQLVDDGRLVAHELVINGLLHGEPDVHAEISVSCRVLDAYVVIAVLDQGEQGSVAVRPASDSSSSGRGLAIVDALSERWTVDRSDGTRVEAWLAR